LASATAEESQYFPANRPLKLWFVWSMKRRMNFCIKVTAAP